MDIQTASAPEARLLVVEDEPNIRELLATSLRFAGFEVETAGDGTTALAMAAESEPDLVVLDVMLPDVDGFEVTRRLRDRGRQQPIVFVTARDATGDKIQGLTVGGDELMDVRRRRRPATPLGLLQPQLGGSERRDPRREPPLQLLETALVVLGAGSARVEAIEGGRLVRKLVRLPAELIAFH